MNNAQHKWLATKSTLKWKCQHKRKYSKDFIKETKEKKSCPWDALQTYNRLSFIAVSSEVIAFEFAENKTKENLMKRMHLRQVLHKTQLKISNKSIQFHAFECWTHSQKSQTRTNRRVSKRQSVRIVENGALFIIIGLCVYKLFANELRDRLQTKSWKSIYSKVIHKIEMGKFHSFFLHFTLAFWAVSHQLPVTILTTILYKIIKSL